MNYKKKINKRLAVVLAAILTMSLAACSSETPDESGADAESSQSNMAGSVQTDEPSSEESSASTASDGGQNILIAYFSLPLNDGVDTVARASRKESDDGSLGNVRFMANVIQENVGGDLPRKRLGVPSLPSRGCAEGTLARPPVGESQRGRSPLWPVFAYFLLARK